MIISVKNAKYLNDYKLQVVFDNGRKKRVNLEKYISGEIFQPLKNTGFFKKFKIDPDIDTICWENGADFSPEFLYKIGEDI